MPSSQMQEKTEAIVQQLVSETDEGTRDSDVLAEAHASYTKAVEEENERVEERKAAGASKYIKMQSTTFELEHCWAILRNHWQFGGSKVPDNSAVEDEMGDNAVDLNESITSNPDQGRRFQGRPTRPKRARSEITRQDILLQHSHELERLANALEDGNRLFANSIAMMEVENMVTMAASDPHSLKSRRLLSRARTRFLQLIRGRDESVDDEAMDSGIGTSLWGLLRSIWKKTVLITGSSRGIGLALAAHYTAAGWGVIGAVQNPAEADKLRSLHPAKIVQLDTSDDDSIRRAAKTLDDQAIDLVINNAGIAMFDDINTVTSESMIRQFTVNAVGPFLVSRAFTPHLKAAVAKQGEAKLVHITSSLGSITRHNGTGAACPGYRTSKAALNMIHMDLTHALKTENITCAAICPGNVATDLNNYTGSLTPTESVAAVVKVIDRLKFEDTGKVFSHLGEELPW